MTEAHRSILQKLDQLVISAGRAKEQYNRGDAQMCIIHLHGIRLELNQLEEDLTMHTERRINRESRTMVIAQLKHGREEASLAERGIKFIAYLTGMAVYGFMFAVCGWSAANLDSPVYNGKTWPYPEWVWTWSLALISVFMLICSIYCLLKALDSLLPEDDTRRIFRSL